MSRLLRLGSGRSYAEVIGDPIAHSKSPLIHNFWLGKLGIDAEYRACHMKPGELEDYFARRRGDAEWRGCNVTIPHKERVFHYLGFQGRRVDAKVVAIRAVNTVFRGPRGGLRGTNTDVDGIAEAVAGIDLQSRHVVVLGAGGAARAAFAFLNNNDCASVRVLARSPAKAIRAASDCGLTIEAHDFAPENAASLAGASLLINATQLGMTGQEAMPKFISEGISELAECALVFDMVYAPLETALLRGARSRGLRTSDGLVMLVGQAACAFEKFFGQPAPREHDAELRALLTA